MLRVAGDHTQELIPIYYFCIIGTLHVDVSGSNHATHTGVCILHPSRRVLRSVIRLECNCERPAQRGGKGD